MWKYYFSLNESSKILKCSVFSAQSEMVEVKGVSKHLLFTEHAAKYAKVVVGATFK